MVYEQLPLADTGLKSTRLGLGTAYGIPSDDMLWAFEQGINYWFWGSARRRNVAKAFKKLGKSNRNKIILATAAYAHKLIPSKLLIKLSVERVLKDLKTDYIDVFQLGWIAKEPSANMCNFLQGLKDSGKVRHIGFSSHNRKLAAKLLENPIFKIAMIRYNPAHRGAETDVFPFINPDKHVLVSYTATHVTSINYSSLLFSKKFKAPKDWKGAVPTPVDLYRFVLTNPNVNVCLTGAKNRKELEENLKVLEMPPMTEEELLRIKEFGDFIRKSK